MTATTRRASTPRSIVYWVNAGLSCITQLQERPDRTTLTATKPVVLRTIRFSIRSCCERESGWFHIRLIQMPFPFQTRTPLAVLTLFALVICHTSCQAAPKNPIEIENHRRGTTFWRLNNVANNHEVEGYASLTSVQAGQQIDFFVNTIDPKYQLTIYRMGYYGGLGARQVTATFTRRGVPQQLPTPDPTTGLVECQWVDPFVFRIPRNWVSGIYLVKLVGSASHKERYVIFVVRNDGRPAALLFQSGVSTYQAYNAWGGKSLYGFNSQSNAAAVKVSYNRPYDDGDGTGKFLTWFDMVAFLEKEGYDVVYSTSIDTHERGSDLLPHKGFLSVGHDEYWSFEMRQNVTAARDKGVNLGFFSADDCSWQIRFEPSLATGQPDRTEVGYKEQWRNDPDTQDPSTYYLVTAAWGQTRFTYAGHPQDALIGSEYNGKSPVNGDILITDASSWVFDHTELHDGDILTGLLGREVSAEGGHQPANTVLLAHSPYKFTDGTTQYGDMTVYYAGSGALVFSAGTLQWSWGLSYLSPWGPSSSRVNAAAQQITRNVLQNFQSGSGFPIRSRNGQVAPGRALAGLSQGSP